MSKQPCLQDATHSAFYDGMHAGGFHPEIVNVLLVFIKLSRNPEQGICCGFVQILGMIPLLVLALF